MSQPPEPADRMEMYLDGRMTPDEADAFRAELADRPDLAEQVRLQERIDGSLKRLFNYAPCDEPAEPLAPAPIPISRGAPGRAPSWKRLIAWGAIAAALTVAAVYVNRPRREFTYVTPISMYTRFKMTGWNPTFRCRTDEEFVAKVKSRLGQGLLIPMNTVGVVLDGWGYGDDYQGSSVSGDTMVLMAHASETPGGEPAPVLMFIDRARNAREVTVPPDSGMRVFEARRGGLVLYEVTPLCRPVLIDAAVVPE